MGAGSEAVLFDIDGDPLAIENNTPIPPLTSVLIGGGSDGVNAKFIRVNSDGYQIMVGAGTAGSPTGGIITIQGVIGGIDVPVSVSGTATVSGTVTANIGTTGGLALDSTLAKLTISQSTALGSNTQVLIGGSVTTASPTYTNGNVNPFSLTTAGALRIDGSATIQPVSGTITANQGGTWNITNISGTISLPTGAATESTLSAISGKLPAALVGGRLDTNIGAWLGSTSPTVGQKPMSSSIPVAIASDQSSIPVHISASIPAGNNNIGDVDIATVQGVVDSGNSTTTPLTANSTFTGTSFDTLNYSTFVVNVKTDVASATNGLKFQWSSDGTNWDVESGSELLAGGGRGFHVSHRGRYFRIQYVNGSTNQTYFRLGVIHRPASTGIITRPLDDTIDGKNFAQIVKAIGAGARFNDNNSIANKILDENATDSDNKLLTPLTNGSPTTFTVDFSTDVFTSNSHGLQDGYAVNLTTTGTLPAPLTTSTMSSSGGTVTTNETIYWVINSTTNTFKLSTSPDGSAVNLTDAGTGTHSFQRRGQYLGLFKNVSQVGSILSFFFSNSKPGVLRFEWSNDGITQNTDLLSSSSIATNPFVAGNLGTFYLGLTASNTIVAPYYRVRIVNGPTDQLSLSGYYSFIGKNSLVGSVAALDSPLSTLSLSQLVRAVVAGYTPDGYFKNARIQGKHSNNSTIVPLPGNTGGSDHIFMGKWINWQEDYAGLLVDVAADVAGTLRVEYSQLDEPIDGYDTSITDFLSITYNPATTPFFRKHIPVQSKWVRIKYINGTTAQSFLNLDTAFVTGAVLETKIAVNTVPDSKALTSIDQSFVLSERTEVADEYVKVKTTRNNNKDSLNTNVTGMEDDISVKPLEAAQARQFTVGAAAVQLDTPTLSTPGKRRVIGIQSKGLNWMAYGFANSITFTGNAMLLPPNSFKSIALDSGVNLWGICEQTGGVQTTFNLTGSSASGTATNTSNALTSNDTRATMSAIGHTIRVSGINYTPTASSTIQSIRVGMEARKQSGQFETVAFVDGYTGNAGAVGSVTSASISAGSNQFLIAAISRETSSPTQATVSGVSGLGLTWTQLLVQNSDDDKRRLDVWWAFGNPTSGTVTASFATNPSNSHIAVLRFSGVDAATPIQASGGTVDNSASVVGPSLAGTNKGMSILAVAIDNATSTPGSGYTERTDEKSASGTIDGLMTETKALTATGSEQATATLSAGKHYAAIGLTLNPSPAFDPVVTLSYETPSGTAGASTSNKTFSSTSDGYQFLDITGDRTWVESNVDNMVLVATLQYLSAANLEVDMLYVEVVDTTGNTVRVSVEQYASTS